MTWVKTQANDLGARNMSAHAMRREHVEESKVDNEVSATQEL